MRRRTMVPAMLAMGLATTASRPGLAQAQPAGRTLGKVALLSLVGDELNIVGYAGATNSAFRSTKEVNIAVSTPEFDNVALDAVASGIKRLQPAAEVVKVVTPKAGSATDPATLLADGKLARDSAVFGALKSGGFTHLVLVSKHRDLARMHFADTDIGSGRVRGLGFYIDTAKLTRNTESGAEGRGFIAGFAYLLLTLVSVAEPAVASEQTIMVSRAISTARNAESLNPWDALTAQEKTNTLRHLIESGVAEALPLLLGPRR